MPASRRFLSLALTAICSWAPRLCLAGEKPSLVIELQNAPNNMEPVDQARRIRVNDREKVIIRLMNLSPVEICSLGGRTPTPTAETNVAESLVGTIAKLGGISIGTITAQNLMSGEEMKKLELMATDPTKPTKPGKPGVVADDELYLRIKDAGERFFTDASKFIGSVPEIDKCPTVQAHQGDWACQLKKDALKLALDTTTDYRKEKYKIFLPEKDVELGRMRKRFTDALPTIEGAAPLQATLDQISRWNTALQEAYKDEAKKKPTVGEAEAIRKNNLAALRNSDEIIARAKAVMGIIADNNKTLKDSQASMQGAYDLLVKAKADFKLRLEDLKIIKESGGVLYQDFVLGTDRKATITGAISCVSSIDGKTPTTNAMNYSILYQNVPHWSASAGLLTSFLEKKLIGIRNEADAGSAPPQTYTPYFRITDGARAQVVPMAYVNYKVWNTSTRYGDPRKEDELVVSLHLSAGFGINPNAGANQPEFFIGPAIGLNRFLIHPGLHWGRQQSLGGGFLLDTKAPQGLSAAPISWSYHPMFSIGFSVRVAPY